MKKPATKIIEITRFPYCKLPDHYFERTTAAPSKTKRKRPLLTFKRAAEQRFGEYSMRE